jgi:transposase-like protein
MNEDIQMQIAENFDIQPELLPVQFTTSEEKWQRFRTLLIARIEELAAQNMEHLMWLLYLIDVDEKKLKTTLQQHPADRFAVVMADAIIERERQKAETRKKFGNDEKEWSFDLD